MLFYLTEPQYFLILSVENKYVVYQLFIETIVSTGHSWKYAASYKDDPADYGVLEHHSSLLVSF